MDIWILIMIDLCTWFKANRLSLNTTKTFYMIFHRTRIKHMSGVANSIVMDNTILVKTSSLKYLGVIVDHKLNWIEHISYIKNKVPKGIGIMYKTRHFLNKKSLLSLYHSYIYPYLIYYPYLVHYGVVLHPLTVIHYSCSRRKLSEL